MKAAEKDITVHGGALPLLTSMKPTPSIETRINPRMDTRLFSNSIKALSM
jgi:hypothetical protein